MTKISYTKPSISELEISYVEDAIRNGWGENCYDYINKLEKAFCEYLGVNYAVATSSCTGALHLGMAALGISDGDEVILADTNWVATVSPVVHLGAKPVFVDICTDTWCIDPKKVELAITNKTKAIIAVHLYGNLSEMNELNAIGEKYGIPVIEDSAEAIGATYQGKLAGSIGKFGAFSFHGTKTMTTGEGGIFVTDDKLLYEKVLTLSNHGRDRAQPKQFWPDVIGYKYKMSNIQAAIGCAQLERVNDLVLRKREILDLYKSELANLPLTINPVQDGCLSGAWMPNIVLDSSIKYLKVEIMQQFKAREIDARVFFHPLSSLPMFDSVGNGIAYDIANRAINLPSYHDMGTSDVKLVAQVIRNVIEADAAREAELHG